MDNKWIANILLIHWKDYGYVCTNYNSAKKFEFHYTGEQQFSYKFKN